LDRKPYNARCSLFLACRASPNPGSQLAAVPRGRTEIVAAMKAEQAPFSNSSLLGEVFLAER
jgi:hypothetical protein